MQAHKISPKNVDVRLSHKIWKFSFRELVRVCKYSVHWTSFNSNFAILRTMITIHGKISYQFPHLTHPLQKLNDRKAIMEKISDVERRIKYEEVVQMSFMSSEEW